jgi:hypothetical protein
MVVQLDSLALDLDQVAKVLGLRRRNLALGSGPRHKLTVRGIVPSAAAIDRVERPSAAIKTILARSTSRCSLVGARTLALE